jgi:hypothetical protein
MEDYVGAVKERDKILDVLVAIVNTAQDNPDRCMADVCNDNFIAHDLPLTAVMTGSEYNRIKIINTSNIINGTKFSAKDKLRYSVLWRVRLSIGKRAVKRIDVTTRSYPNFWGRSRYPLQTNSG